MATQAAVADSKRYHHGDLRRALLDAAEKILERDGPEALSLRAVAREAGVSPAAPYHHFKDKDELLRAVGKTGFANLKAALKTALDETPDGADRMAALGLTYVEFAQKHPAIYRVMYDCARRADTMPDSADHDAGGLHLVKNAITEASAGQISDSDAYLAAIAAWCAAHGLAEMSSFAEFASLKAELGGERAFLRGVLEHLMFARAAHH